MFYPSSLANSDFGGYDAQVAVVMEKKRKANKRERKGSLGEREKEGWSDFLGEKKSCIWRGIFLTFGFYFCHVSFISFKMGEKWRFQD